MLNREHPPAIYMADQFDGQRTKQVHHRGRELEIAARERGGVRRLWGVVWICHRALPVCETSCKSCSRNSGDAEPGSLMSSSAAQVCSAAVATTFSALLRGTHVDRSGIYEDISALEVGLATSHRGTCQMPLRS